MMCIKISALSITMDDVDYKMKYIKYKVKYLQLLEELEGGFFGLSKKEKEQKLAKDLKEKEKKLAKGLTDIFDDIKKLEADVKEDADEVNDIKDNKREPLIEHIQEIKIIENTNPTWTLLTEMYDYFTRSENANKKKIFAPSLEKIAKAFEKKSKRYSSIRTKFGRLAL